MSYLYVKWNRSGKAVGVRTAPLTFALHSQALPGTKACDAAGGEHRCVEEGPSIAELLGGSYPSRWPLACCRLRSLHYFRVARSPGETRPATSIQHARVRP